ncbi:MAG: SCO family protein [Acidimicrobiales bacterium]
MTIESERRPASGDAGGGPGDGGPGAPPPGRHRRGFPLIAILASVVVILAAVAFAVVAVHVHDEHGPGVVETLGHMRPSGVPADVSTPEANLMALSPVPPKAAPGFDLTDQNGQTLSLSSFRGKVVILEAMDPHCTDICPIVSQEFVDAYHDLGPAASNVVFAAVNVNQYHAGVADMMAFSRAHQLTSIPSWHFFTGPVPELKSVWHSYGIAVQAPNPNADIIHTSIMYFIGPDGVERYLASPSDDHTKSGTSYLPAGQLASWGHGIAAVAEHLIS